MRQKFGPTPFAVTSGVGKITFSSGLNGHARRLLVTPPNSIVTASWQAIDADNEIMDYGTIPGGAASYLLFLDAEWLGIVTFKILGASQDGSGWKASGLLV